MLRQFPLASIGLVVGGCLTVIGLVAYAAGNATLNLVGFFYGIPVLLGGLALKAAELKPVPYSEATSPKILALREQQATPIQNQIRKDVTRYRYGQEAHLEESLSRLGLSPTDEERPVLRSLRETEVNGSYTLVLEFESPLVSLDSWSEKEEKIAKFFGPGIRVNLSQPEEDRVDLALIALPA
ncbi:MAG: DUF2854 domain-containing protein [Oscillatoria sp. PMC 1051.18]|nr:DUF2854 domain-containing protein [Oscillatoria sp. PMC 1050.18]MEC5029830.1 DUF2854 domain-containing protein [Oscillatoria sp. PMC 1051.18]